REPPDLAEGRLDVVRLGQRHRLDDDGRSAPDRDVANPDPLLRGHLCPEDTPDLPGTVPGSEWGLAPACRGRPLTLGPALPSQDRHSFATAAVRGLTPVGRPVKTPARTAWSAPSRAPRARAGRGPDRGGTPACRTSSRGSTARRARP